MKSKFLALSIAVLALLTVLSWSGLGIRQCLALLTDSTQITNNTFTTDTLDPPTTLAATAGASAGTIDLSWTATVDTYASGYRVFRDTSSGGPYAQVAEVTPQSATTYQDTSLTPGTTYYYVLRSFYQTWESVNSNEASATAPGGGPTTLLDDGFEGDPWDANWDDNGVTDWYQKSTKVHSGLWSARADKGKHGLLTTDDLDASGASSITVSFWYYPKNLVTGDVILYLYDGSAYDTWYDLADHSSYVDSTWCYFSETITDSQYFTSNFRLRFDSPGIDKTNETLDLDDVLITKE